MKRGYILRICILTLTITIFAACSAQPPLPVEPTVSPDDGAVSAAAMLEDIDYLLMMLKLNYPFYGTQTTMFSSTLSEIRERISRGQTDIDGFRTEIESLLQCFVVRAHLNTISPEVYHHQKAIFDTSQQARAEYALWSSLFDSPRVRDYYENQPLEASSEPFPSTTAQILQQNRAALVVLPTFDASRVERDHELLLPFFQSISGYSHVILDLRGNTGGSTEYWMTNVLAPLQRSLLTYDTAFLMKDGMINRYFTAADALMPSTREWIEASDPRAADILTQYGAHADIAKDFSWIVQSRYRISPSQEEYVGFKGKLYVLCDARNRSAAEAFIAMCKMTGFAVLVGETTGGDGLGSGDPMYIALPNTGILVRYTATYALNPDGTCNQVRGTVPDYEISEGEDALDACLEVIAGTR